MKLSNIVVAALAALAISPTAMAASASSSASIYDITFEVASTNGLTLGAPGGEATTVQYYLSETDGTPYFDYRSSPVLFADLSTSLVISGPTGSVSSSAVSGSAPAGFFMQAAGSSTMPLGFYSASTALNQDYQGTSTFGGWFTLAADTRVTMSGRYDMSAALGGTLCDVSAFCSNASAEVRYGLQDDVNTELLQVSGDGGPVSGLRSQSFSLTFTNDDSFVRDVFFMFSVAVQGIAANVLEATGGGGDGGPGGPGGGGNQVPEPASWAMLLLGLAALGANRRRAITLSFTLPARPLA